MRIQCDYCEQYYDEKEETCPFCGAVNRTAKRTADGVPRTVEELKAFAQRHNLPLEKMRFFIGENYTGPRAYGIYQDENNGSFIVYKNKSDGSRAVRYEGRDEAYAVNELYQKMKTEVAGQKARLAAGKGSSSAFTEEERQADLARRFGTDRAYSVPSSDADQSAFGSFLSGVGGCLSRVVSFIGKGLLIMLAILFVAVMYGAIRQWVGGLDTPQARGYYRYEDETYYYWHGDWYTWDDDDRDWYETDPPDELAEDYEPFLIEESYYDIDDADFDSFSDGSVYQDYISSDDYDDSYDDDRWYSSWDDDDDWDDDDWDWDDDDDWDSGWSDWDDDW